jgi:hypothetical protein
MTLEGTITIFIFEEKLFEYRAWGRIRLDRKYSAGYMPSREFPHSRFIGLGCDIRESGPNGVG